MKRFHSYINTALQLIQHYKGDVPFSAYIKQFFAREHKYGSSDRKQIAMLCYSYFRLGQALHKQPTEANLLIAAFLCHGHELPIIQQLRPEWTALSSAPIEQKLQLFKTELDTAALFPFFKELNTRMDAPAFALSFLIQPALFVRIRPKHKATVVKKITAALPNLQLLNDNTCLQLPSTTPIDKLVDLDREAVIQDYNSQQVLNYLKQVPLPERTVHVWDCCAASGGKSILLTDLLAKNIKLTVSDIRTSTMIQLHQRFRRAGIKDYDYLITDAATPNPALQDKLFDLIICDAPCTGSGTWSRTPEQLYFFEASTIEKYATLQKAIVSNVIEHLKPGAIFVYITCSVFKQENEAITQFICNKGLLLLHAEALYGYAMQADSMYVAIFQR